MKDSPFATGIKCARMIRKQIAGGHRRMEAQDELYRQALAYYQGNSLPLPQEQLVELLREIQDIYGCIPPDIQQEIGEALKIKPTVIKQLIRLYPSLKEAGWHHRVTVCLGPRCAAKQAEEVLETVSRELGAGVNKISKDGRFLFTVQNCMKNCRSGPNMRVDQDLYPMVKISDIRDILQKYN